MMDRRGFFRKVAGLALGATAAPMAKVEVATASGGKVLSCDILKMFDQLGRESASLKTVEWHTSIHTYEELKRIAKGHDRRKGRAIRGVLRTRAGRAIPKSSRQLRSRDSRAHRNGRRRNV